MAMMKVKYVGLSGYRVISADDLRKSGVEPLEVQLTDYQSAVAAADPNLAQFNPKTDLIWGQFNDYTVSMDVDSAMEELLRRQGHFTLVADDDEVVVEATDKDHPGDTVVANDGAAAKQVNKVER